MVPVSRKPYNVPLSFSQFFPSVSSSRTRLIGLLLPWLLRSWRVTHNSYFGEGYENGENPPAGVLGHIDNFGKTDGGDSDYGHIGGIDQRVLSAHRSASIRPSR